jgi:plasmid replication initiation protein
MTLATKKKKLPNSLIVTQSNELVEARYSLPLGEQRLLFTMLSRIQPDDEDFKEYRVSINEFAEFMRIDKNHVYTECKKTTEKLITRGLTIQEPGRELQVSWVSSADYIDGEGYVRLCFDPKLKPYLLKLKSNFTSCKLDMLLSFKSQYTMRFYALLKQYERLNERKIELLKLREILGLPKDVHSEYRDFKRHVLLMTQKELKAKADLYFDFQEIKYGRRVGAVLFHIHKKSPLKSETPNTLLDADSVSKNPDLSTDLIQLVPSQHQIKKTVLKAINTAFKKHGADYVERNILYANAKAGTSYAGYLNKALKEDWGRDWLLDHLASQSQSNQKQNVPVKPQGKTTIEQFVQDNPTLTRGKTTQEVLNLMAGRR